MVVCSRADHIIPVMPLPCWNCQQPRPMGVIVMSVWPSLRSSMWLPPTQAIPGRRSCAGMTGSRTSSGSRALPLVKDPDTAPA